MTFHANLCHVRVLMFPAILLFTMACRTATRRPEQAGSGTVFILLDASTSISKLARADYLTYLNGSVVPRLHPGEHVLLSLVGGKDTYNGLKRLIDKELPTFPSQPGNGWDENRAHEANACLANFLDATEKFQAKRAELRQDLIHALREAPSTQDTYLLDGFEMAGATFAELPSPHTLIVLSDALEDSREGDSIQFDQANYWRQNRIESLLRKLKDEHRIPSYAADTEVYFVGASASSATVARNVRAFWFQYLRASNVQATCVHYGARPQFRPAAMDPTTTDRKLYCHAVRN